MPIKNGFQTSEFWTMIANTLANMGVMMNIVNSPAVPDLVKAIVSVATSVITILGAMGYILSRVWLKANVTPTISPISPAK